MTTINGTDRGETLPGTSSADSIKAFDGDDFLSSGGGNDTLLSGDFLDGGSDEGVDSADYRSFKTNGVTVDLAKGTANDGTGTDTLIEIENVKGTDLTDTITGTW